MSRDFHFKKTAFFINWPLFFFFQGVVQLVNTKLK